MHDAEQGPENDGRDLVTSDGGEQGDRGDGGEQDALVAVVPVVPVVPVDSVVAVVPAVSGATGAAEQDACGFLARELVTGQGETGQDHAARVVEEVLRDRLAVVAQAQGLLDVAYRTLDTPVGEMLLAATETGVVRVAFAVEGFDHVLDTLSRRLSPRVLRAPARLDQAAREVEEYFAGARRSFDLPLDLTLTSGFRREVVRHLPEIPYGSTASYADVAALAGSPRAVRAVGTACATNPLPVVVPCHRVVRSDGSVGQYAGGPAAKRVLLALESPR